MISGSIAEAYYGGTVYSDNDDTDSQSFAFYNNTDLEDSRDANSSANAVAGRSAGSMGAGSSMASYRGLEEFTLDGQKSIYEAAPLSDFEEDGEEDGPATYELDEYESFDNHNNSNNVIYNDGGDLVKVSSEPHQQQLQQQPQRQQQQQQQQKQKQKLKNNKNDIPKYMNFDETSDLYYDDDSYEYMHDFEHLAATNYNSNSNDFISNNINADNAMGGGPSESASLGSFGHPPNRHNNEARHHKDMLGIGNNQQLRPRSANARQQGQGKAQELGVNININSNNGYSVQQPRSSDARDGSREGLGSRSELKVGSSSQVMNNMSQSQIYHTSSSTFNNSQSVREIVQPVLQDQLTRNRMLSLKHFEKLISTGSTGTRVLPRTAPGGLHPDTSQVQVQAQELRANSQPSGDLINVNMNMNNLLTNNNNNNDNNDNNTSNNNDNNTSNNTSNNNDNSNNNNNDNSNNNIAPSLPVLSQQQSSKLAASGQRQLHTVSGTRLTNITNDDGLFPVRAATSHTTIREPNGKQQAKRQQTGKALIAHIMSAHPTKGLDTFSKSYSYLSNSVSDKFNHRGVPEHRLEKFEPGGIYLRPATKVATWSYDEEMDRRAAAKSREAAKLRAPNAMRNMYLKSAHNRQQSRYGGSRRDGNSNRLNMNSQIRATTPQNILNAVEKEKNFEDDKYLKIQRALHRIQRATSRPGTGNSHFSSNSLASGYFSGSSSLNWLINVERDPSTHVDGLEGDSLMSLPSETATPSQSMVLPMPRQDLNDVNASQSQLSVVTNPNIRLTSSEEEELGNTTGNPELGMSGRAVQLIPATSMDTLMFPSTGSGSGSGVDQVSNDPTYTLSRVTPKSAPSRERGSSRENSLVGVNMGSSSTVGDNSNTSNVSLSAGPQRSTELPPPQSMPDPSQSASISNNISYNMRYWRVGQEPESWIAKDNNIKHAQERESFLDLVGRSMASENIIAAILPTTADASDVGLVNTITDYSDMVAFNDDLIDVAALLKQGDGGVLPPSNKELDPLVRICKSEGTVLADLERLERDILESNKHESPEIRRARMASAISAINHDVTLTPHDVEIMGKFEKAPIEIWGVGRMCYVYLMFMFRCMIECGVFTPDTTRSIFAYVEQTAKEKADLELLLRSPGGPQGVILGKRTKPQPASALKGKRNFKTGERTFSNRMPSKAVVSAPGSTLWSSGKKTASVRSKTPSIASDLPQLPLVKKPDAVAEKLAKRAHVHTPWQYNYACFTPQGKKKDFFECINSPSQVKLWKVVAWQYHQLNFHSKLATVWQQFTWENFKELTCSGMQEGFMNIISMAHHPTFFKEVCQSSPSYIMEDFVSNLQATCRSLNSDSKLKSMCHCSARVATLLRRAIALYISAQYDMKERRNQIPLESSSILALTDANNSAIAPTMSLSQPSSSTFNPDMLEPGMLKAGSVAKAALAATSMSQNTLNEWAKGSFSHNFIVSIGAGDTLEKLQSFTANNMYKSNTSDLYQSLRILLPQLQAAFTLARSSDRIEAFVFHNRMEEGSNDLYNLVEQIQTMIGSNMESPLHSVKVRARKTTCYNSSACSSAATGEHDRGFLVDYSRQRLKRVHQQAEESAIAALNTYREYLINAENNEIDEEDKEKPPQIRRMPMERPMMVLSVRATPLANDEKSLSLHRGHPKTKSHNIGCDFDISDIIAMFASVNKRHTHSRIAIRNTKVLPCSAFICCPSLLPTASTTANILLQEDPTHCIPPHLRAGHPRHIVVALRDNSSMDEYTLNCATSLQQSGDTMTVLHVKDWVSAEHLNNTPGEKALGSHSLNERAQRVAQLCYLRRLNVLYVDRTNQEESLGTIILKMAESLGTTLLVVGTEPPVDATTATTTTTINNNYKNNYNNNYNNINVSNDNTNFDSSNAEENEVPLPVALSLPVVPAGGLVDPVLDIPDASMKSLLRGWALGVKLRQSQLAIEMANLKPNDPLPHSIGLEYMSIVVAKMTPTVNVSI